MIHLTILIEDLLVTDEWTKGHSIYTALAWRCTLKINKYILLCQ